MKQLLESIPRQIDTVYEQFTAASQHSAKILRWSFVALFFIASLWNSSDDSNAQYIYPALGLLWLLAALIFGRRTKTNPSRWQSLPLIIDLAIISAGLSACAWLGVFNTKGWLVFLCYFPVLALTSLRFKVLLVLQVTAFIIVFYAMLSLFAIGSLVLPRLLMVAAMGAAVIAIARKPKKELVAVAQQAVQEAYQRGSTEKAAEMVAIIHAQSFPPPQYDLPGLYTAYKHGVGTNTSGDFYTALATPRGPLLVIGDLPGDGLNAALAATQLQRHLTQIAREKDSLTEIAAELNAWLHSKQQQAGGILARWEGANLHYVNAGHLPAIRISKREPESLPINAPAFGAELHATFTEAVYDFPKGDLLLMYTDGAYAGLASDRTTGAAEILRLTDQFSSGEVNTICHRVFDCGLPEYRSPEDDSTVVIARRQDFASETNA